MQCWACVQKMHSNKTVLFQGPNATHNSLFLCVWQAGGGGIAGLYRRLVWFCRDCAPALGNTVYRTFSVSHCRTYHTAILPHMPSHKNSVMLFLILFCLLISLGPPISYIGVVETRKMLAICSGELGKLRIDCLHASFLLWQHLTASEGTARWPHQRVFLQFVNWQDNMAV